MQITLFTRDRDRDLGRALADATNAPALAPGDSFDIKPLEFVPGAN